jgi:ATP-binding cassette subfamily C protein CydC
MVQVGDPLAAPAPEVGTSGAVWRHLAEALDGPMTANPTEERVGPPGSIDLSEITVDRGRGVIIDQLSLRASPGQTVLVTGPSGVGKSSLLGALVGAVPVVSGRVRLTGTVTRLPQHPSVVRGTVADNLRLAAPGASNDDMQEVLVIVGLDDALGREGLDRRVGPGGWALSGGQARRLGTAQGLLARPDILLADEPTRGLDAPAARELLLAMRLFDPWMTLILVLHSEQRHQLSWVPDTRIRLEAHDVRSASPANRCGP